MSHFNLSYVIHTATHSVVFNLAPHARTHSLFSKLFCSVSLIIWIYLNWSDVECVSHGVVQRYCWLYTSHTVCLQTLIFCAKPTLVKRNKKLKKIVCLYAYFLSTNLIYKSFAMPHSCRVFFDCKWNFQQQKQQKTSWMQSIKNVVIFESDLIDKKCLIIAQPTTIFFCVEHERA